MFYFILLNINILYIIKFKKGKKNNNNNIIMEK